MRTPPRAVFLAALCAISVLFAPVAQAGSIGTEVWLSGGASWPEYHEKAMACARAGAGVVFVRHFTLGVSGQVDRHRFHYFADTSVILPAVGLLEPFGRFQIGRRDDRDDTAMAASAGVRVGDDTVRLFVEGFWIFEPEENYGACLGISF